MIGLLTRYYNRYRRSVSHASFAVYKATMTNIMAFILFIGLSLFYVFALAYRILDPIGSVGHDPNPIYLIIIVIVLFVLITRPTNALLRQMREHGVLISLILIILFTHYDIHDITQEGMYMIMIIFLSGFVTKPKFTFLYTTILCFIFINLQDAPFDEFTIVIVSITFAFIGLIAFLLSLTTLLIFEEHKRNMIQLQQLYESDKKLFSNLAHRLKTPLTVLQAEAKFYQRSNKQVNIRINHVIEDIRQSINELTELSKMNLSKMAAQRGELDLVKLIKNICKDGEILAQNYQQLHKLKRTIIWQTSLKTAVIDSSADQLRESLLNLIDNSIRHNTPKEHVTITIILARQSGNYVIGVVDNGVGITEEKLKDILARKSTTSEDSYHQHIGLEISRNLIRANGGKLRIFSNPKEGTTVQIFLPINV